MTNPTFVQHTTNPTMVEVCVSFFLPTDARHWIPNGTETVDCVVDAVELSEDPLGTMDAAEQAWSDQTHGIGSFWGIIVEDGF